MLYGVSIEGFSPWWVLVGMVLLFLVGVAAHYLFADNTEPVDKQDCNLSYYDIRDGRCPHAEVHRGKIFCCSPKCSENRGRNEGGHE